MSALLKCPGAKAAVTLVRNAANRPRRILVVEGGRAIRHFNVRVRVRSGWRSSGAEDGAREWIMMRETASSTHRGGNPHLEKHGRMA